MNKYLLILAIGLVAGCKTASMDDVRGRPMDNRPATAQWHGEPSATSQRPAVTRPMRLAPQPMIAPGPESPTLQYFKEARQNLKEARTLGFISNAEYANLLEKLQADIRQIMIAEAEGRHPPQMMPLPMRPPRPDGGGKPPKPE